MPPPRTPTRTPPRTIGRYALHGEIASGGMATVHFGRLLGPVGFSRTVAIKRLHPQFAKDPEFVSMFLDEARLAGRIRHPNVVPTLDVVAAQGQLFLVMEYVQGESLARLLGATRRQGGGMPAKIVASIVGGALHGLHAAHEAKNERGEPLGIVHRDVSPHNILVGTDGVARVLDFGVAKAVGRLQTTQDGQIKGKIPYMAPEQLRGVEVTRATDVYAASVVLWEALTGRRLFDGDNQAHIMERVLFADVQPPSAVRPELGPAFDALTMRGLDREPSRRFRTAREMALALERTIGVCAPSEVGELVEGIASEMLTQRAQRVAEIEQESRVYDKGELLDELGEPDAHAIDEHARALDADEAPTRIAQPPTPHGRPSREGVAANSQVSSVSLSKPGAETFRHRGKSRVIAIVAALSALAIVGALAIGRLGHHDGEGTRPSSSGTTAPSMSLSSPTPSPSSTPKLVTAPSASESEGPKPIASMTGKPLKPTPSKSKPKSSATATKPGCDPGYTFDAQGVKHYKVECL